MSNAGEWDPSAAAAVGSFVGTFALIMAAIAVLFALDTLLAEKERAESRSEARRSFQEGLRMEQQGHRAEAVDRLRFALSAQRDNPVYQRGLARALLEAGEVADAQSVLIERLQRDPADATACLIMARTLVRQNQLGQAISYYHRAIYGQWDDDHIGNPVQTRFELAELLAAKNFRQPLLAELLPLQSEAPRDIATRKRLGRLFLAAESPSRAVEIFRGILRDDPGEAEASAGLGEAEFQRGNYRAARTDFQTALKLASEDQEITARLALINQVLALDPTQRGIGTAEQYRRSLNVLRLTLEDMTDCAGSRVPNQELADSSRAALERRVPARRLHDAVEENLDLAERLWEARRETCPGALADSAKALALVLEKAPQ